MSIQRPCRIWWRSYLERAAGTRALRPQLYVPLTGPIASAHRIHDNLRMIG